MKRILMIVGDFVEDYEVMVPLQIVQMFGHRIDAVCPDKVALDTVPTAIHDFEGHQTYTEKWGHNFALNATFAEVDATKYDGLIVPGGRAPEYLQMDQRVLDLVRAFANAEKPLAATCHGLMVLAAADVLKGKKCQGYVTVRPEVEWAGGIWDPPSEGLDSVTVDGNLVTAAAWPGVGAWMKAFLQLMGTNFE
ncbi:MAG: DJ-1/PfpI family protein [Aeoliella sp.]